MAAHINEQTKHIGDVVSIATVAGTLMEWLPAIAAGLTVVWTLIRIYETDTVQKLLKKNTPAG
jgi:molybdenum cofactor biosynthesis enzyme